MKKDAPEAKCLIGQRGRYILRASSWSLMAKTTAAANLFVSIPFVLKSLGPEEFGVWATLGAFATFSTFLDFGLSNGAMNLVAAAHGRNDSQEVTAIWYEALSLLLKIASLLAVVFLLGLPWISWYQLLGLPSSDYALARSATAVVMLAIVISVPLGLAMRMQLGLGRGQIAFQCQAFGNVLTLGTVVLLARAHAGLVALVAAAVLTPLIGAIINMWSVVCNSKVCHQKAAPLEVRQRIRRSVSKEGVLFFYLQVSAALVTVIDLPLISTWHGAEDAGLYAIVQRLFSIVTLSLGLFWSPLWPMYRKGLAAGHHAWIRRTLRWSILLATVFAAIATLALLLCFDIVTRIWLHRELAVHTLLIAGFALWSIADATGSAIATFLNSASIFRYQLVMATWFVATCIIGKIWILRNFEMTWLPWVTLMAYTTTVLAPTFLMLPGFLKRAISKRY